MVSSLHYTRCLSLPKDVFSNIVTFFPADQQLETREISKLWHCISTTDLGRQFALMQSIARLPEGERSLFLVKHPRLIEHLVTLKFNEVLDPNYEHTGSFLSIFLEHRYGNDMAAMIAYLNTLSAEKRSTIQSLALSGVRDRDVAEVLKLCPNIKSLTLQSPNITGECLARASNRLENLHLSNSHNLNEGFLAEFFRNATQLKEVSLYWTNTTGEGLSQLPRENQLEKLDVSSCDNLEEDFLKGLFLKAAYLKELDLSQTNTTGEGLSYLPKNNQLEELNLRACENLQEPFLQRIRENGVPILL